MSRLEELAEIFERASKRPINIIDPPFCCVTVNLVPEACVEISGLFRAWQTLLTQSQERDCR